MSLSLARPPAEERPLRILDFDTEVRPLSYLGSDFTTGEVTGIACAWIEDGEAVDVTSWLLGDKRLGRSHEAQAYRMAEGFRELYDQADIVTGHYIRGYDLPVLNGMMLDLGYPPLEDKRTHCTKGELVRRKYVSASQENLGALLYQHLEDDGATPAELEYWSRLADKVQMNTPLWRRANRLSAEGIDLTRTRVEGDVRQHVQLRERLMATGWLDAPRVWRSTGANASGYTP